MILKSSTGRRATFIPICSRLSSCERRAAALLQPVEGGLHRARYKQDYAITKEELEYLASRIRKLQETTKWICEGKIAGMA